MSQPENLGEPSGTVDDSDWQQQALSNESAAPEDRCPGPNVNVFDYQVSSFDGETTNRGQEMQEIDGKGLLAQQSGLHEKDTA
jgi:hypothetical protein